MQWRGWINDGITKPPNGPLWRDIGCCVCPRCRPQEGMATEAASANCPRRSENPPAARFFTHLSFRVAFSGVEKRGHVGLGRRKNRQTLPQPHRCVGSRRADREGGLEVHLVKEARPRIDPSLRKA